jgi:hypothetical protein
MPRFKDYPDFKPDLTPRQMFTAGTYGGSYFRPIHSSVTGKNHKNVHKKYSFLEGIPESKLTNPKYDKTVNKYGVKSGQTLAAWEASGWIHKRNPYGWIHWYCDFYSGKRGPDDERQIKRWLNAVGPKGRWRRRLLNDIKNSGKSKNDASVSPVIRQLLLHWAAKV